MDIELVLSKYVAGEASVDEIIFLEEWRKADESHERIFREFVESWDLTHSSALASYPDKEKVWLRIMTGIRQMPVVKMYSRKMVYGAASVAAVVALMVGFFLSWMLARPDYERKVCFKTPSGQKAEVDLPDGTKVILNANSMLTYAADYGLDNRCVQLEGQAFFDVKKDERHAFCVTAGGIDVVVYGTSFDVNAYQDEADMAVTLVEGHVKVFSAQADELLADMKPNQKLLLPSHRAGKPVLAACDAEEETLWHQGKLKISGESLAGVLRKMERWYGVNITLLEGDKQKSYWLTIKTESLRETLEIINHITPINYSIDGEEVIVTCKQ